MKNYRCELTILDNDELDVNWLHERVYNKELDEVARIAPKAWKDYLKGNINKLDVWGKSILKKSDQLPELNSDDSKVLDQLRALSPTQFEAVVVDIFKNLKHISHKITRTRPTSDGGFDFYGEFSIPFPINYDIQFLGEVKKYARKTRVEPKDVSRLVARLGRGQYGLFVTTSYYTEQAQKEVLEDGYPVRLFSGNDILNIMKELRLINKDCIKKDWIYSVTEGIN